MNNHSKNPENQERFPDNLLNKLSIKSTGNLHDLDLQDQKIINTIEELSQLSEQELYQTAENELKKNNRNPLVTQWLSARAKMIVINNIIFEMWKNMKDETDTKKARDLLRESDQKMYESLQKIGLKHDYQSLPEEDNLPKPKLIFANHQGGGYDTAQHHHLPENLRSVLKSDLLNMPIFGTVLQKTDPIPINRPKSKDKEERKIEAQNQLEHIAREIIQSLQNIENVIFYFEGTRSDHGEIGEKEYSRNHVGKVMEEIQNQLKAQNIDLDYQKIAMVGDSLLTYREPIEKNLRYTSWIKNNSAAFHLHNIDHIDDFSYSPDDDLNNIFRFFRAKLKGILIAKILRLQDFNQSA